MKNIFDLIEHVEQLKKAARSTSQFIEMPEWMLAQQDTAETLDSSRRSQAKRILAGKGKLKPADVDKLIEIGRAHV